MACTRLNLFILPFGSCLPFTGESLHPGIPSQMSQHRKPLVEPQYLIIGLLVPEKYTRSHRMKLVPSLSLSPYSSSLFLFLFSFFFLFTSLFLFRRTFSNLPPSYFARNFLPLLSSFSYFLNYPRGFDPSFDSSFLSFSFLFFFWRFLGSYVSFSFQFTFDLATSWKRLASFSLSPQRRFSPSFRPRSTTLSVTFSFQRSSLKPLPYATRFLDETFYPRIPDSIREISDPFRIFFRILSRNQGITSEKIVEILKNYIYIHIIESLNKVIESKSIR